ncbi:three-Cys-motif partner protein TcmP [Sorangium cellulosum]|uniref:three-Cys-motif partner protein TcmP n=1 Tax=Sorangium cellulosum TaxID=56 RepID=UPI0009B900A2|nr:three-Cys-motif partner protein TcmP [Sorangium cellulosum]
MSDTLPTIWELEPHTAAKHRILRSYLDAWFPILARHPKAKRVLYVDAFAGPGEYKNGEDGSPVIALKAVLEHSHKFDTLIRLVFVEQNQARCDHLRAVIGRYADKIKAAHKRVEVSGPHCDDCEKLLSKALAAYEAKRQPFGPALIFLDQFGYSDVPLALVANIMRYEQCEVFSYLHGDGIRRFLEDPSKHEAISRAYGGDSWKAALKLPLKQRVTFLANEYQSVLKSKAGVKFVWHFAMHGEGDKLLYWLFFCTNHRRGLEEMKRAMAKVDTSGGSFKFSDAFDPGQLVLFDRFSDKWLEEHLSRHFAGKEITVKGIAEHVLEHTPGVLYKTVLKKLEDDGAIEVLPPYGKRRRGSFPDENLKIRFRS